MNPEPPGYKVGSLPDRPQSSTSGRLRTLFESQETDRDMALGGSASFRLRFLFSVNLSALTGLNKRGPQTGSPLRNSHTYIHTRLWTLFSIHKLPPDTFYVGDFDSSQWKLASLRLLVMCVCPSVLQSLTTLDHLQSLFYQIVHKIWSDFDRASSLICGNKMKTRCNRCFLLQILLLAEHVSGTIMPIIRS